MTANLVRLADGDRSAFEPVYSQAWPVLQKFCRRHGQSKEESEDIAQQALLKVFNRAGEFRIGGDALSWILGIASFECMTARKKIQRRRESSDVDGVYVDLADTRLGAEEQLLQIELEFSLSESLEGLSDADRETILISIHNAKRPDIPNATFRKRLQRATDKFRTMWSNKYE